jgi:hypothetical protein
MPPCTPILGDQLEMVGSITSALLKGSHKREVLQDIKNQLLLHCHRNQQGRFYSILLSSTSSSVLYHTPFEVRNSNRPFVERSRNAARAGTTKNSRMVHPGGGGHTCLRTYTMSYSVHVLRTDVHSTYLPGALQAGGDGEGSPRCGIRE